MIDLDIASVAEEGEKTLLERLTDDEFILRRVGGGKNFFEQALNEKISHANILYSILKGRLDEKDPRFKELVS